MTTNPSSLVLDLHGQMLLDDFAAREPLLQDMGRYIQQKLSAELAARDICTTLVTTRVKEARSLAGKIALKGAKYATLDDITDLVGARVVTLFSDDVDKVAAAVEQLFDVDWQNSVDKRKLHELRSFGYNSLHFICRLPAEVYSVPGHPEVNTWGFEIQMRSTLQHVWADVEHDIGYKTPVGIPAEYRRLFSRLSGMLELVDDEFCRIRSQMADYRRRMETLLAEGELGEVELTQESFDRYCASGTLGELSQRIAAINQAEVLQVPLQRYCAILLHMGMKTLGDVDSMLKACADDAIHMMRYRMDNTDLDILTSDVGLQSACIVHLLRNHCTTDQLASLLDEVFVSSGSNLHMAERLQEIGRKLFAYE